MEQNIYIEKYRKESIILDGNRNGNSLNQPVVIGNPDNLKSHLLQIRGNENGVFFDSHHHEVPARITTLREQEQKLEKEWKAHLQERINLGERPPQEWPLHLQDRKDRLAAKKLVAEEEIEWLEQKLQEAEEQKAKSRGSLLTHPKYWGGGSLRNGILESVGPWQVSQNEDGMLCINDETSPYHTMPVWRFRSQITNPMSMEYSHRLRSEERNALAEGRKRNVVGYPKPPVWSKDSDLIEYEGYHNDIIKKLKQEI